MHNRTMHPTTRFFLSLLLPALLAGSLWSSPFASLYVQASDLEERIAAQQALPIESNQIEDWPQGPVVTAESAILMEVETGTILYAKNIHQHQYPASCTKILTCLIASEECEMDEIVTMSHDAVYDTPLDSSYISLDVGNEITMEQALNAILISSANNVSFAVAEHITGTDWESFAQIMNDRAKELGCVDSHFVNPNGLPDEDHYTSAYDLATIGRAFFSNELLSKISRTTRLHLPPTEKQPKDIIENTKNRLLPNQSMAYEYLVGSKTGYTNAARNCLVSCAEKDGLKLVCVVLKDESPRQFEDTLALFEYGFQNFERVNIADHETTYNINADEPFYSDRDIFGSSRPLLELNQEDFLVLPAGANFDDTTSTISYDVPEENQVALIDYTYSGVHVGTASVDFMEEGTGLYSFGIPDGYVLEDDGKGGTVLVKQPDEEETEEKDVVFINIQEALLWAGAAIALIALIVLSSLLFIRIHRARVRARHPRRYNRDGTLIYSTTQESLRRKRRMAAKRARNRRKGAKRPNRFRDYDF